MKIFHIQEDFVLESGVVLNGIDIAYHTYGTLNPAADNAVWVCHALTANSDVADWWSGLVGPGRVIDPDQYFIVCANILGSCYGSTGPQENNPKTGVPFGKDFPLVTIRDIVNAQIMLRKHLEINKIRLALGGSMGGQQALEWAVMEPEKLEQICVLATNAKHSPWGIAFNEAQRMAIETDPTTYDNHKDAGRAGLAAARAVAMLSYRNYLTYQSTQSESDDHKIDNFSASSYQRHQGKKLVDRFNVLSYLSLSRSMDSHNLARGRGSIAEALQSIRARTLVIGIRTDVLFPIEEQSLLTTYIPRSRLEIIDSLYGHDGFLVETEVIGALVKPFLAGKSFLNSKEARKLVKGRLSVDPAMPGSETF
ncbi:MAG: homoserine O-acetyltransferase [Saprospiraceae bacterium]|nr:MAG: homoserine O-acetyltransferase [Saprospiraceae bacterium]